MLRKLTFLLLLLLSILSLSLLHFPHQTPKHRSLSSPPSLSIFIGILTVPNAYSRRHLLRLVYGIQSSPIAQIDVKFVVCSLNDEQMTFVSLEILRFDDVIVLNCTENMNSGKTHAFFSSLPSILPRRYDYVMKADDDTYIRFAHLAASLSPLPRTDLYYGFVIPCNTNDPFKGYMSGMGYALSWDIVEWIADTEMEEKDTIGPEDKVVGKWLEKGKKSMNRWSDKPKMYDYPGSNGRCSHKLAAETVAVHRLKTRERWLHVLRFFNVTTDHGVSAPN